MNRYDVDFNKVLVKPLYIGLLMNIFIPVVILAFAYYFDQSGGTLKSLPNQTLTTLFWIFVVVSIAEGGAAILLKQRLFFSPMISSRDSFEEDLTNRFFTASIVCFAVTTAITIYGLVFYILGGTFQHLLLFVFISFIAFQFVRPRFRFAEKVVAAQEKLVDEGRFYQSQK